jgi:rubrerythrin
MVNIRDDTETVLSVLKKGMELESFGIKFFTDAAEEVTDPRGRQTLKFLASEEREHLKFIKDLKKSFEDKENDKTKSIIKTLAEKSHIKVFPAVDEYLEKVKIGSGDQKILEEAEGIEKRSIEFYKGALMEMENGNSKDAFNILIKEEEGHLKLIEQMQDYMTLHGVWSGLDDYFVNE